MLNAATPFCYEIENLDLIQRKLTKRNGEKYPVGKTTNGQRFVQKQQVEIEKKTAAITSAKMTNNPNIFQNQTFNRPRQEQRFDWQNQNGTKTAIVECPE